MSAKLAQREKLVAVLESAHNQLIKCRKNVQSASAEVEAFDAEYPDIMEAVHKEAGKRKQDERGSSGKRVSAEGHAEVPMSNAEGR